MCFTGVWLLLMWLPDIQKRIGVQISVTMVREYGDCFERIISQWKVKVRNQNLR